VHGLELENDDNKEYTMTFKDEMTDNEIAVHVGLWDGPSIEPGDTVWNAPRPLLGQTWEGQFVSGIFYAITRPDDDPRLAAENLKLGARQIRFITNADVEQVLLAQLKDRGLSKPEDVGYTMAELAEASGLPYIIPQPQEERAPYTVTP